MTKLDRGVSVTKRHIKKYLKKSYLTRKKHNNSHDLIIRTRDCECHVKIMKASSNTQVTINSKEVWEFKRGRVNGLRFKEYSKTLYDISRFMELENRIIILTNKPYRIYKYINESEVVDVSNEICIYNTSVTSDLSEIKSIINGQPYFCK